MTGKITTKNKPHHEQMGGNGKTAVIPGDGDLCPRCGVPMQIREHDGVGDKQLRKRCYYTRWFCCMNKNCKTTLIMPKHYKVMNPVVKSDTRHDNAKPTVMQAHKTIVIPGEGDPCPRCGVPMEIRGHNGVGEKQLRQPYYYTRWFCCVNNNCKTTLVMAERYKVMNVGNSSNTPPKPTVMRPEPADPNKRPPWE